MTSRVLVAICLLGSPVLHAQTDSASLRVITANFNDAMRRSDFDSMAALMHPDALGELRELLGTLLSVPEGAELREMILGVTDSAQVAGITDAGLFASFMRFVAGQEPLFAQLMASARIEVIGHVMEGDTAHVVLRTHTSLEEMQFSEVSVISFRKAAGVWRGLLTGDVSTLATALRQMVNTGMRGDPRE